MDAIPAYFFEHNTWANLRLLDACAELTEPQLDVAVPGTFGTIRDTLVHLAGNEENYLALLTGEQPEHPLRRGDPFPGMDALRERFQRSGTALAKAAVKLAPDAVLRGTHHGEPYAIHAVVVLLQVINHGTEHRAHVATILSRQGIAPPTLDSWAYHEATATNGA